MSAITLYEIASEYKHITDILMDSGCDEQTLKDTLDGEAWPLELKSQNYCFAIRNLEVTAESIDAAIKQMKARQTAMLNRATALRERLKFCMEVANVTKIDCPHFALSIAKNPPSVDIYEPSMIPLIYMRQPEPPPPAVDKAAIKEALKAGKDVPGALLAQGTRLSIK